jgi:hypothetical protein
MKKSSKGSDCKQQQQLNSMIVNKTWRNWKSQEV